MSAQTRIFIMSDTHGQDLLAASSLAQQADVVIHCGDLTDESKIGEFQTTIELLRRLRAPLKLVIAGNHDLTLDEPTFRQRLADSPDVLEPELVQKTFGASGAPRRLFEETDGIHLLDEGTHEFLLQNNARLRVYASPFTPSTPTANGWAYQYANDGPDHAFDIPETIDVAITHGPPLGVLDRAASGGRIGCPGLFKAVSTARPRLHCFDHVHGDWGAQLATWRDKETTETNVPSHFNAFDHERSLIIEKRARLVRGPHDDAPTASSKAEKVAGYTSRGFCYAQGPVTKGAQTLFVNAAIQGCGDLPVNPPWVVDLDLPLR